MAPQPAGMVADPLAPTRQVQAIRQQPVPEVMRELQPEEMSQLYGPDGMPLEEGRALDKGGFASVDHEGVHHGVELGLGGVNTGRAVMGWFHAESNHADQEQLARDHMSAICSAVDQAQVMGLCPDGRWTNDPEVFPDLRLRGTNTANGVVPFPPHDQQYYIRGIYDPNKSKLRRSGVPSLMPDQEGNSLWVRLVDCADHAFACRLFDDMTPQMSHCGRVMQGTLDNGYFVEALQAISLRPKLARQLFYCWDERRSVYIARLHKHGTWMRVEVDDYVPVGPGTADASLNNVPICCRSEHFPHILWPSLIEKAYAKLHTLRGATSESTSEDRGGWEALGGGGRVEEALADLTGGVAGRFSTCDVTVDRLFIYIYELQRDTLFVCRPHQANCDLHGVRLNPYYPLCVNRATSWAGRPYIQCFCGAPGIFDGGLQDLAVPYGLLHCEDFPEKLADGFFWVTASDFHEYIETIFECRLVNSGDVSIVGMPEPRLPPSMPAFGRAAPCSPVWHEHVYANPGEVTVWNPPEFTVRIPEHCVPCDIIASVEQIDPRMLMTDPTRPEPVAFICKVYEASEWKHNAYSTELVCKSNWLHVRDAMVAFTVNTGGEFKVMAEPYGRNSVCDRMVFRCYASRPGVMVTAATSAMRHELVEADQPTKATKLTLVGSMQRDELQMDRPQKIIEEFDSLRRPEFDVAPSVENLKEMLWGEAEDCSIM